MRDQITIPLQVMTADVIFVSHSGGKDSQAMLAALVRLGFKVFMFVFFSFLFIKFKIGYNLVTKH